MKFRLVSIETGEQMTSPENYEYLMHEDGSVSVLCDYNNDSYPLDGGFVVEFAFSKDDQDKWIWSHSIVND